jgi:hypothetical protein
VEQEFFFSSRPKRAMVFRLTSSTLFAVPSLSGTLSASFFFFTHLERDQRLSSRGAIALLGGGLCVVV